MDIVNLDREITEDDYPEKFLIDEREDDESESNYSIQSDVNHNLIVARKKIATPDSCFSANDNSNNNMNKEMKRLIGSGVKDSAKKEESVLVVVRCRPMSEKEKLQGHSQVVEMWPDEGVVLIRNPKDDHKERVKTFTFDAVYDWNSTQQDLYDEMVRPLVESVLNGFNATIFAYGQTGTGKTYTMEGCRGSPGGTDERGIIPKSFEQIFTHISRTTDKQHLIRASYLEIYQEEVRDLLDKDPKKRYELRESKDIGVYVKDLQSFVCKSVKEIEQVMNIGNKNRTIGATNMNEHSSRSHAIFMITIEMSDVNPTTKSLVKVGKLNLVDLAGSERQTKTGASGNRLKEASKINLSLSALGNVISALVDDKCQHVPYRDSKLTRLLQDSLGGNSKTLMVANIGPASYNYDESLTTLRYANRAKNIQNKPRVNEDPKDALIRQYQEEIERLKDLLYERMQKSKKKYSGGGAIETFDNFEKEQYYQREEDKLDEKKASILRAENITDEEMQKQLRAVEEKRRLIAEERKYSQDLLEKIKSMESKLLQGGKNIIDHTNQQQKDLERRMAEIREKKQHAYQMQKRLDEVEEAAQSLRVSYSNLLEEVEAKKKQLNKLITKYQRVKQEIADNEEEHNQNRRELELSQKEILKEIKLRQLIIDNFIPPEERRSTEERLFYDEDDSGWQLMPDDSISRLKDRPIATAGVRRPTTQYTLQQAKVCNNPRFKCENLILLDLDYPERCTKSYEPSLVLSSLRLRLEDVLRNDEDLLIDTSKLLRRPRIPVPIGYNSRSGKNYPQARGLVPK